MLKTVVEMKIKPTKGSPGFFSVVFTEIHQCVYDIKISTFRSKQQSWGKHNSFGLYLSNS